MREDMCICEQEYPDYLAIRRSQETWANYICRAGIGGKDDVTYIKQSVADEQAKAREAELVGMLEITKGLLLEFQSMQGFIFEDSGKMRARLQRLSIQKILDRQALGGDR